MGSKNEACILRCRDLDVFGLRDSRWFHDDISEDQRKVKIAKYFEEKKMQFKDAYAKLLKEKEVSTQRLSKIV